MKWLRYLSFFSLTLYSALLIFIEIRYSQDYVRHYFTDIDGPVLFYAVNTSLCVFLLLSCALLFAVCLICLEAEKEHKIQQNFYWSQIILFIYLALDDRFLFHEKIGGRLGVEDGFILLGLGVVELLLLFKLGQLKQRSALSRQFLFFAAIAFGVMIIIDAFVPRELVPRLSIEDLAKTWANLFLFLFAWESCCCHINALKRKV